MTKTTMKIRRTEQHAFNRKHRLEGKPGLSDVYKVLTKDFTELVDCRVYFSASFARCTCCVWVRGEGQRFGSGSVGGYGYHKASAAVQEALTNAGFSLGENRAGVGEDAIKRALLSVAKTIAPRKTLGYIHSHG